MAQPTVAIRRLIPTELPALYKDADLAVALQQGEGWWAMRLRPNGTDGEPVWSRLKGRVEIRTANDRIVGAGDVVATRRRLLLLIKSNSNGRGLNERAGEIAIVTVNRDDLEAPTVVRSVLGKIKRIDFGSHSGTFTISLPHMQSFEATLEVMSPEYALTQLGPERSDEIVEERRAAAEKAAAEAQLAEQQQRHEQQQRFASAEVRSSSASIFDHRRTFRYKVAAPPNRCVDAFVAAFSSGGGVIARAKWSISRTDTGAVATYGGRKGLVAVTTAMSDRATSEMQGAVGSQVRFEIEEQSDAHTICAMWLAEHATQLTFVNDGRFFRPYMRQVEAQLRHYDPALLVVKE